MQESEAFARLKVDGALPKPADLDRHIAFAEAPNDSRSRTQLDTAVQAPRGRACRRSALSAVHRECPIASRLERIRDGGQTPLAPRGRRSRPRTSRSCSPWSSSRRRQRVANTLEHVYGPVSKTLSVKPGKITVMLPNQTTVTNAGVGFGPLHAESFSTPFQTAGALGTGEWYDLLAAHEIRHVAQIERTNTGFSRALTAVMGDVGRVFPHLVIPGSWFEGDAVGTESALSNSGRARMPEFDMEIRTMLLSGETVSYATASHGSLGRWYPNEYNLGTAHDTRQTHVRRRRVEQRDRESRRARVQSGELL